MAPEQENVMVGPIEEGNVMLDPMGLLLVSHQNSHDPLQMPASLLRSMLLTNIWQNHQRGRFGFHDAVQRLAQLPFLAETGWAADKIAHVLQNRAVSAVPYMEQLLDVLHHQLHLRLFCVCNASSEELAALRRQFPALFAKFHATFASAEEGVAKPSLRFLQVAMEKAGICAHRTLYLDSHDFQSIVAARSLGMHALMLPMKDHTSPAQLYHALLKDILLVFKPTLLDHPPLTQYPLPSTMYPLSPISLAKLNSTMPRKSVAYNKPLRSRVSLQASSSILSLAIRGPSSTTLTSARQFLLKHGANNPNEHIQHASLTSYGVRLYDNFAQFLMADLLNDTRFLPMQSPPANGLICFTPHNPYLKYKKDTVHFDGNVHFDETSAARIGKDSPTDLDTTSLGLSILHKFGKVELKTIHEVLDKMLKCLSEDDGLLQTYFDLERPRIDPVAMVNVIFLFHLAKRGHEVEKSERFVESVLLQRAYEDGTLYYTLGDAFLVSVARLVHNFEKHFTSNGMRSLLALRLQERVQKKDGERNHQNALALVMHLRACDLCGLEQDAHTKEELVRAQKRNGSWDGCPYTRYGINGKSWIGNEALTTAYAYALLVDI